MDLWPRAHIILVIDDLSLPIVGTLQYIIQNALALATFVIDAMTDCDLASC